MEMDVADLFEWLDDAIEHRRKVNEAIRKASKKRN